MLPLLLTALVVAGCNSLPKKASREVEPAPDASAPSVVAPYPEPPPRATGLDEEIVLSVLAGEVAAQRGEQGQAHEYLMRAARLSGDAGMARRAAEVAMTAGKSDHAIEAARLWVELAPNAIPARQLLAMLLLRKSDTGGALEQLKAVVRIAQSRGEDGFLHSLAAVTRDQDRAAAIGLMAQLRASFPDDPRSGYAAALTAVLARHYKEAEQEAQLLIRRHPDWQKGHVLLARIAAAQDQQERAKSVLEAALQRFPDDAAVRTAYARLLIEMDRPQQAYDEFLRLSRQLPEDAEVFFSLGLLALQMEQPEIARGHFKRLIALGKRVDVASYYLGRIEEDEKNTAAAIEWFERVDQGRYAYEAQVRRARLLAEQGKLQQARDWLQSLRIRRPRRAVQLYLLEGEILQKHAGPQEVMALYEQSLKAHPGEIDLLYARALFAATQSRVDILERDLGEILKVDPEHADALNALGYTLADQTTRYREALGYIERALKLKPDSPAILDSMGWVQYRLGNTRLAIEYLRKAMGRLPDPEIAAHLGEVLWVSGAHEEARAVWQGALERSPESKFIHESMRRLGLRK